ncbi:DUF3291 domain-containing protein [Thalassotalea atypica]|uniref:DUF3291 domain-containing protein n=1 Tax=Thalassotalea atypica TaxID=2054316 RepID=UPI002572727E|nr:DUF3291 domain-containing protein [Thalassotalea atypica]
MAKVLAELNIATALAPLDSPQLKEFTDNLDRINGIAEQSPGFVWRLEDETGNATNIQAFDNPNTIINLSVWKDVDALKTFMFKTDHVKFFKRKAQWFEKPRIATYVLWWIEDNEHPTVEQGIERLEALRANGETPEAFSFKQTFEAN